MAKSLGESDVPSRDTKRGRNRGKRKSKPTTKRRAQKQYTREKYSKAREDAQLQGVIPTTPEGAVRPERVDPRTQGVQETTALTTKAIRNGWAVPEEKKPDLVDELMKLIDDPEVPHKTKVAAFNALRAADQTQYERDHPDAAGRARGAAVPGAAVPGAPVSVKVTLEANVAAVDILNRMLDDPGRSLEDCALPDIAGAPGDGGHAREVAACAAPEGHQQGAGQGVADA